MDGKESNRDRRRGGSTEVGGGPMNLPLPHPGLLNKAKDRSLDGDTRLPPSWHMHAWLLFISSG